MEATVKQRLVKFAKFKEKSVRAFEIRTGLTIGYVNAIRVSMQPDKIQRIASYYPELNLVWLLTGEGEMLKGDGGKEAIAISQNDIKDNACTGTLVYDIDGTCGKQDRDIFFTEDNIIGSVDLPEISKSSKIIRANGDSMEPVIPDGSRIVIREILSRSDIFYGQIYLVITEEYRMIKRLRRYEPDEENYVILRSENPKYDDIRLHKSKIIKMFVVENILSVKTQM